MTRTPRLVTALLGVLVLLYATIAQADSQAAQKAFDEGMALMKAERFAEACIKLEESQRIEAGMGTQFRLAQCYEKAGRIASAWKSYEAVATAARAARLRTNDGALQQELEKRESYSQSRADALVAKVARTAIRVPSDVALLAGLAVSVDGVIIQPASWGNVPVDVGTHRVVVQATGKRTFEAEVKIVENGERMTVQVPPLSDAPNSESAKLNTTVVVTPSEDTWHPLATAGLIIGAVGLVGMAVGVGLGFAAKNKHDDSAPLCNGDLCQPDGVSIREDALTLGNIGTGVFIAGAVAAAGGIALVVAGISIGGEDATAEASLTPTGATITLRW